jgi:hypothetical protein
MNAADVYRLRAIEARLGLDRTAADRATESERQRAEILAEAECHAAAQRVIERVDAIRTLGEIAALEAAMAQVSRR